jgi:uncharacterized protein YdeI (YjbR/CyaY-like superfamily)
MPSSTAKTFTATLERSGNRLHWTFVRIPFDVAKTWGTRGHLRVRGEINGVELRGSLFPTGNGTHVITLNKKTQKAARVAPGSTARLRLEPDLEERPVVTPPELKRVLRESRRVEKFYAALPRSARREIGYWIAEARHAETRTRRAEHMAERLLETIEAERELPPAIALALARTPGARAAWDGMSPAKQRHQLLSIFYYRTPESRARRIERMIENMLAWEEKHRRSPRSAEAGD